jgi:hypothetical protein
MTIEQQVLEKLRDLPPDKQKEVLDFVDFLKDKDQSRKATPQPARIVGEFEHKYHRGRYRPGPPRNVGQFPARPFLMPAVLDTHAASGTYSTQRIFHRRCFR